MTKKWLLLAIAACMVLCLFSGCTGSAGNDVHDNNNSSIHNGSNSIHNGSNSNDGNDNIFNEDNSDHTDNGNSSDAGNEQPAVVDPADFTQAFSYGGLTLTATAEYEKTQETPSMMSIETENVSIWVQHYSASLLTASLQELAKQDYQDTEAIYASMEMACDIRYTEGSELCYYIVSYETMANGICTAYYQVGEDIIMVRATYNDANAYGAEAQYIALNGKVN